MNKLGLGGGCHWCTEAVFQSLVGVAQVEQGFIASQGKNSSFSEAVIVHYDEAIISLRDLIEIHLYTHKSTSEHRLRNKYRSAIYVFDEEIFQVATTIIKYLQKDFDKNLVTKVLYFEQFKPSDNQFHNYYYGNPEKPFCETYIKPKLGLLMRKFSRLVDQKESI